MRDDTGHDPLNGMTFGVAVDITDDPGHPLHDVTVERMSTLIDGTGQALGRNVAALIGQGTTGPIGAAIKASDSAFAGRIADTIKPWIDQQAKAAQAAADLLSPTFEAATWEMPDLDLHNPTFDVLDETRKTNELLLGLVQHMAEMVDVAKQDADTARADAAAARAHATAQTKTTNLSLRWNAVGVVVMALTLLVMIGLDIV